MSKGTSKKPGWRDLKRELVELDQRELLKLIQDLYGASKENKVFLHTRFALGEDLLQPYKAMIERWTCPDVTRDQDYSISKAKKAISDYRKAVGHPEGMAELSVFYCESCAALLSYCGMGDERYFVALVGMFEQALKGIGQLSEGQQTEFLQRLDQVRAEAPDWGWGVSDDMDELLFEYGFGVA